MRWPAWDTDAMLRRYIAAKRAHWDKVIELLNDVHKAYPPVRSAMELHFSRMTKGEPEHR